ncbi:hypothetical protein AB1Y20_023436 [Prymnesium parvum]|uniref:WW domain-containing protein n=1 Tax=Prymnesium parvum TaxID=97485 RepID=A0AB34JE09_PRYPA
MAAASLFGSMAASARAAGDATERAAKRTKLLGEIELLHSRISTTKKEFGKAVYDAMAAGDQPMVSQLFREAKAKVDEMEASVAAKRDKIAQLKLPSDKREPGAPPYGAPPGYGAPPAGPPPPGLPPAGPPPAGPPPGYGAPPAYGAPPVAYAMPTQPAPVPPPGPPPGEPPLPPGWKKTSAPDGRDYYYHSATGETSWAIPAG